MRDKLRTWIFPTGTKSRLALALFILRLFVGIAFIQHGSGKLMHPVRVRCRVWNSRLAGIGDDADSIHRRDLLILGALTPLAALGIAGTMMTATIFLISRGEPFINSAGHSWENSAFYLTAGICLALSRAGSWSLDAWFFGPRHNIAARDVNRASRSVFGR